MKKSKDTTPYDFQEEDIRFYKEKDLVLLNANEMGLGKTLETLAAAKRYLPKKATVLVVCPAYLKWHWMKEAALHVRRNVTVLSGTKPKKTKLDRGEIYVISYNLLQYWKEILLKLKPDLIVADECQNVKNLYTKQTQAFLTIGIKAPHRVALGGTGGLENNGSELFPVCRFLWPKKFTNNMRFCFKYSFPHNTPWGLIFRGVRNADKLHKRLKKLGMIRRRKKDVLKDLPKITQVVVPLDIQKRREYEAAELDFTNWLARTHPSKVKVKNRSNERLVRAGYLLRLTAKLKKKAVREWIEEFTESSGKKLLVFGTHRFMIRGLAEDYDGRALLIDGKVHPKERDGIMTRFAEDPDVDYLFGNTRAAGTGLSCKATSYGAFVELDYNPAKISQAMARNHGIGRGVEGDPTTWYFLVAHSTVEEKIVDLLEERQKNIDQVIDGAKQDDSLVLLDQLESFLLRKVKK